MPNWKNSVIGHGDTPGNIFTDRIAEAIYEKNKNIPWVKRIMTNDKRSIISPFNKNEFSTHLMASSDNLVFPMITDNNGKLEYIEDWRNALEIAKQKGDVLQLPNEQMARYVAENGYKQGKYWRNFNKQN